MSTERFGDYLLRRRMELGIERGKPMNLKEMAQHLHTLLDNPLLPISHFKYLRWEKAHAEPAEAVQLQVREKLGNGNRAV